MALLVTLVLANEVQVIHTHHDRAVHLRGLDDARQDATANGHVTRERALLIDVRPYDRGKNQSVVSLTVSSRFSSTLFTVIASSSARASRPSPRRALEPQASPRTRAIARSKSLSSSSRTFDRLARRLKPETNILIVSVTTLARRLLLRRGRKPTHIDRIIRQSSAPAIASPFASFARARALRDRARRSSSHAPAVHPELLLESAFVLLGSHVSRTAAAERDGAARARGDDARATTRARSMTGFHGAAPIFLSRARAFVFARTWRSRVIECERFARRVAPRVASRIKRRHFAADVRARPIMFALTTTTTTTCARAHARARRRTTTRTNASVERVEQATPWATRSVDFANTDGATRERACGTSDWARVDMAKAKCVHPDRPVAKLCGDCPRRK